MSVSKPIKKHEVVLIYVEKEPSFFARVEKIQPDLKKGWWRVTFLVLNIPLTNIHWTIDDEQLRGSDFTMGGVRVRIERVESAGPDNDMKPLKHESDDSSNKNQTGSATIISLTDRQAS